MPSIENLERQEPPINGLPAKGICVNVDNVRRCDYLKKNLKNSFKWFELKQVPRTRKKIKETTLKAKK